MWRRLISFIFPIRSQPVNAAKEPFPARGDSVSVTVMKSGGTFVPSVLQHPDENTAERAGSM